VEALQYSVIGAEPEIADVPVPEPGPGQVRIKVTAAGACHSDVFLMSLTKEQWGQFGYPLPMTLGHEGAGVVDMLGDGVTGLRPGTPVAVFGPQGCGRCYTCAAGKENYCPEAARLGIFPPGLGAPGAMAEYMIVPDARHLVPLEDLDPVASVALTDAGLTPYHAIKGSLGKLVPGSTAVVIGTGGLGHVAIQILKAMTPSQVIALDVSEAKLQLAVDMGADHTVLSDSDAAASVREIVGKRGATAVFDFVVNQATVDLGSAVIGTESDLVLVGVGAAPTTVGLLAKPYDSVIRAPYWGSRSELIEVLNLARAGLIRVETEEFTLDEAPEAYRRLHAGTLRGRAIVTP
jgi:propanol-preferring alcohol dehydrogenase